MAYITILVGNGGGDGGGCCGGGLCLQELGFHYYYFVVLYCLNDLHKKTLNSFLWISVDKLK